MEEPAKIFIVEDEKNIARFLQIALEKEGFKTATERNGKRAYERIMQEKFDLVLLDVMLPEMDGMEICQKVREVSDVPIIMLTARDEIKDIHDETFRVRRIACPDSRHTQTSHRKSSRGRRSPVHRQRHDYLSGTLRSHGEGRKYRTYAQGIRAFALPRRKQKECSFARPNFAKSVGLRLFRRYECRGRLHQLFALKD